MPDDERQPRLIRSTPRLTRDEIVNQSFAQSFRGLSEASVRAFLRRVADEYEAVRSRHDELFAEIDRLQHQLAQPPAVVPENDLLAAVGEETARVLRSATEAADEIRRGAEERATEALHHSHEEARLLLEQAEHAATERTRQADEAAAEVLEEAERLARELHDTTEARVGEFAASAEAEARAELESARRRSRELVAEAEATRERMLNELARRRDALEGQLELLRGGRERLLDAYKTVRRTLEEATDSLRTVDARPATEGPPPRVVSAALPPQHAEREPEPAPEPAPERAADEPWATLPETGEVAEPAASPAAPPRVGSFQLGELEGPVGEPAPERVAADATGPARPLEKYRVEQPSGVRLLGTNQEIEPEPAPEPEVDAEAHAAADTTAHPASRAGHETVDKIFARLRAQAAAPAPAEDRAPVADPEPGAGTEAVAEDEPDVEAQPAPEPPRQGSAVQRRRDDSLDPLAEELIRVVKRVVRDEQNLVLESVRRHKGVPSAEDVLPSVSDQDDAFSAATEDLLNEACAVGESVARELGVAGGINGDGARRRARARELASALARELMDPVRGKLGDALRDAAGSGDESEIGERVRARYRDWKGQRVDNACRDALSGAFARGLYDAVPDGIPLQWMTTDTSPCPDCADNALEHTPRGRKFPTGHAAPPAHPGCHCLVLPAEISADLLSGV